MKTLFFLVTFVITFTQSWCQTTVTLQPNPSEGKDAVIWYLSSQSGTFGQTNTTPNPTSESFQAMEWTWNGSAGVRKSLIDFDISSIPANSLITSAKLSLYAFPNSVDGGHSPLSGSNACYLTEISSPWDENTVTWNTQPTINVGNQLTLPQSNSEFDDYLDFDVTAIIQNKYLNPNVSHGFMLSIINSNYYRQMIFASSDHPNPLKRPKLEITYTSTADQEEVNQDIEMSIYPNPTTGIVYINSNIPFAYSLTDMLGREVKNDSLGSNGLHEIDLTGEPNGVYMLTIKGQNVALTKRLVLE